MIAIALACSRNSHRRRTDHRPRRDDSSTNTRHNGRVAEKIDTAIILITHDLGIVANVAQWVAVMYAGKIVETGTLRGIFTFYDPKHPYTWGLLCPCTVWTVTGPTSRWPISGNATRSHLPSQRLSVCRALAHAIKSVPGGDAGG